MQLAQTNIAEDGKRFGQVTQLLKHVECNMRKKRNFRRTDKRQRTKEGYDAQINWHKHIIGFHEDLFLTDWDNVPERRVFTEWNDKWQKHCLVVNKKYKTVAADPRAFYNYAISQRVEDPKEDVRDEQIGNE